MLLPILLALAVILLLASAIVAGRPDETVITRTATFAAPAETVFAHVNDLRLWQDWSPWAKLDPGAQNAFEGPACGVGSALSWSGNNKVGAGRMAITGAVANESIQFQLDFVRPFRASNTAAFTFRPVGAGTEVSWRMSGKSNFFFKVFGLFVDCEAMVGKDFEKGLANLRARVEKTA